MGRPDELSPREWELVHTTYAHALGSLERNEDMGERRFQLLLAVASAAGVAVGLVADISPEAALWAGTGAAFGLVVLGLLTVSRLARRNVTTTGLIEGLTRIRREVAGVDDRILRALMVHDPYVPLSPRRQSRSPTKGGLVDVTGCTPPLSS